ncbi:MAG: zf-HC2 domain-containing protein [Gemmatimonadales bacterium]
MSEHLNELLSSYVDDDVSAVERMRIESHLAQCEQCRADVEGLRRVVRRAATLDDRPPQRDLWAGIQGRIGDADTSVVVPFSPRRRRFAFTVPQLAAAAAVLVALSAGGASLLMRSGADSTAIASTTDRGGNAVLVNATPEAQISAGYDAPIRELQQALQQRRGQLDTATVRVIEQSLTVIDAAIRQARAALAKDPNNTYLNGHLQRALDRKLDLLRQAATLPVVS